MSGGRLHCSYCGGQPEVLMPRRYTYHRSLPPMELWVCQRCADGSDGAIRFDPIIGGNDHPIKAKMRRVTERERRMH